MPSSPSPGGASGTPQPAPRPGRRGRVVVRLSVHVDVREVEGGLAEQPQGLLAGEHPGEFPAEQFVDDEPGVVVLDVEVPQQDDERGDVYRQVAVGEHLLDSDLVLLGRHRVDVGPEQRAQLRSHRVDDRDDPVRSVGDPRPFPGHRVGSQLHARPEWLQGGGSLAPMGRHGHARADNRGKAPGNWQYVGFAKAFITANDKKVT